MMPALQQMKALLYEEMELIVRTSVNLLSKIKQEDLNFRPRENMRSLRELAEHLAAIPAVDLIILQQKTEDEVRTLEAVYAAEEKVDALSARMQDGVKALRDYMDSLTDDEFLHLQTKPFYLDHPTAQAKWLVEIVTHLQHHRGQLFTYLKMQGYEVNMFDLY